MQGTATAPPGPLEMVRKALISLCPEEPKLAETFKLEDLQRLYDAGYRCKSIMKYARHSTLNSLGLPLALVDVIMSGRPRRLC